MNIERFENRGIVTSAGKVFTFEIQGSTEREELFQKQYRKAYDGYLDEYQRARIGDYLVPSWGDQHNLYPQEVYDATSSNKLLPELLEKQKEYLFGKGLYLYREVQQGGDIVRVPVEDVEIQKWLDSWERQGLAHPLEYLMQCIDEYYHVCTIPTQYHFSKARRIAGPLPIMGLSCVGTEQTRLATSEITLNRKIYDADCKFVMRGDWLNPSKLEFEVFPRFNPAEPFKNSTAISFVKNKTFTKDVYAYNKWFKGLYDWIRGANLNPKFINSYLKNALNARVHVIIPSAWVKAKEECLRELCDLNIQGSSPVQKDYQGVPLVDDAGTPLQYNVTMIDALIDQMLKRITTLMAGEGKNQGKLWASIAYNTGGNEIEQWKFEEIPSNYKEFISSLIEYDKRADQVITAGRGIPSSISNVDKDGIISKSGNDVYYSYMIYIDTLTIPEYYVCLDLNRAIALNWPHKRGIKVGLYHRIPAKLQETAPAARINETAGS